MFICIDFDGTIVDHAYPDIGAPAPEAIEWMKKWYDAGADLILWTMRSNHPLYGKTLNHAVEYVTGQGVVLFGINANHTQREWTDSPKAYGNIYVDDAAIGVPLIHPEGFNRPCVDWSAVGPFVMGMMTIAGTKPRIDNTIVQ